MSSTNSELFNDLGEIVNNVRERLVDFESKAIQLSDSFKKAFQESISTSGNSIIYEKNIAIISNQYTFLYNCDISSLPLPKVQPRMPK